MPTGRPDGSPTAVDVVLRPEWAAVEGIDKTFGGGNLNGMTYGANPVEVDYTVPTGKTLYITDVDWNLFADAAANADANQIGVLYVSDSTTSAVFTTLGGNGGAGRSYSRPIIIPAGHVFHLKLWAWTNHPCGGNVNARGYEVTN
jgi:hypothetical protein